MMENKILYANTKDLPSFDGDIGAELTYRTNRVVNLARLLCLIFPYKQKSSLVQQCLNIYIRELNAISAKKCGN